MSISTVLVVNSCLIEHNLYLMLLMFKYAQLNVSGCFFLCSVSSLKMSYVSLFSSWVLNNELPVRLKTLSFDLNDVSPKSVNFGNRSVHILQKYVSLDFPSFSYSETVILVHFKWVQLSQKSHWMAFWFDLTDFWHRVQGYFIGPGLICMSPLSKILNIRQYVDGLAIFLFPVMIFSGRSFGLMYRVDPKNVFGWCSQICSP